MTNEERVVVVVVTNYFPTKADPLRAIFVQNLTNHMRAVDIRKVVAPLPWVPPWLQGEKWEAIRQVKRIEKIGELEVLYPRHLVVPKIYWLAGFTYGIAIYTILRKLKKEYGSFVIHAHCAFPDGVGVSLAAKWLRIPFVITAHGSDINVYAQKLTIRWQVARALRAAAAVVGVSKLLIEKMRAIAGGDDAKFNEIPCAGYDRSIFYIEDRMVARQALRLQMRGKVVVFIGNLVAIKGIPVLLEAWSLLKRSGKIGSEDRLVIIGSGSEGTKLRALAKALDVAYQTIFTGARPYLEIPNWLNAADVLCLSSYHEGTPNVIVEALACGTPVVATAVGGIPAMMGSTGLPLVPAGDPARFADALATTLRTDWNREQLKERVHEFSWAALAEKNSALLQAVAADHL